MGLLQPWTMKETTKCGGPRWGQDSQADRVQTHVCKLASRNRGATFFLGHSIHWFPNNKMKKADRPDGQGRCWNPYSCTQVPCMQPHQKGPSQPGGMETSMTTGIYNWWPIFNECFLTFALRGAQKSTQVNTFLIIFQARELPYGFSTSAPACKWGLQPRGQEEG